MKAFVLTYFWTPLRWMFSENPPLSFEEKRRQDSKASRESTTYGSVSIRRDPRYQHMTFGLEYFDPEEVRRIKYGARAASEYNLPSYYQPSSADERSSSQPRESQDDTAPIPAVRVNFRQDSWL
jgi:hypothetical protein